MQDPQLAAMMSTMNPQQQQMFMQQMQQMQMSSYMTNQYSAPPASSMQYSTNSMFPPSSAPITKPYSKPPAEPAPTAPPKRGKLAVKLKPEERGTYSSMYDLACPTGTSKIEGKDAVAFLRRSGLPKDVLKQIWEISAKSNASSLVRDEFYIALRLVALAQADKEVSERAIMIDIDAPLPRFDAPAGSYENSPAHVPDYAAAPSPSGGPDEEKYAISDPDLQRYLKLYNSMDKEQRGFLDSDQMKLLLQKTHLPAEVTGTLWNVCDEQGTGSFPKPVAIIAIHFSVLSLRKVPLPRSIPEELKRKVFSQLGGGPAKPAAGNTVAARTAASMMEAFGQPGGSGPAAANVPASAKVAAGTGGDDLASLIKRAIETRRTELQESRQEESETAARLEAMRERNRLLGAQLQKMRDDLAALQRATGRPAAAPQPMAGRPGATTASNGAAMARGGGGDAFDFS